MSYPFKHTPYAHQLTCWEVSRDKPAFAIFAEMGTGKTKITIDTAAWLWDQGCIGRLAVVAPKGVYRNWTDKELPAHTPDHIPWYAAAWTPQPRKAEQEALAMIQRPDSTALQVACLNVEAFSRADSSAEDFLREFLRGAPALLVIDESTVIKNPKAARTKALMRLSKLATYRRILTGQPVTNNLLDLYSQFAFLDPDILGFKSFFAFRGYYALTMQLPGAPRGAVKILGFQNEDRLQKDIKPYSFVAKKADCLDLPPKIYLTREVDMSPAQARVYWQMKEQAIVEVERALRGDEESVETALDAADDWDRIQGAQDAPAVPLRPESWSTANIVITQMLRLHQIACGFLVNDARQPILFEENPRLDALLEVLDEIAGKAVVWATYKVNIRAIVDALNKVYGPGAAVAYYGETPTDERPRIVEAFQRPDGPKYFVSNKTGARGLTLTAAADAVYYSNDCDWDTRSQSEDRIHRIGQHSQRCTYTDLIGRGTLEPKILAALQGKKKMSELVTSGNWREWLV